MLYIGNITLFLVLIVIGCMADITQYTKIPYLSSNKINPNIKYQIEPLRLYQTSESRIVTSKAYKNCYQKWIELNPNICIEWFNSRDRLKFMRIQGDVLL